MNNGEDQISRDIEYGPPETQENSDQYLNVLHSKHRRQTLRYLQTYEHTKVEEIAEHLNTHISEDNTGDLKIDLHHNHLPALRDQGLLSFDPRSEQVTSESIPDFVEEVLELTQEHANR